MSWIAQVGHVMAKDARQLAWLIAVTLSAVAFTTLQALELVGAPEDRFANGMGVLGSLAMGMPLIVVAGALYVALLVQADSPARSDAFWVTRPLAPSAVLAAKVVAAVTLVVLIPLAAQLAALVRHDVPAGRIPALLGESVALMAGVIGVVAVIASLTSDLRTFVVALLGATLAWMTASRLAFSALGGGDPRWSGSASNAGTPLLSSGYVQGLLFALLGLALVAHQYRVRDVRRTLRVFALPALASVVLVAALPRFRVPVPADTEVPAHVRARDLRVEGTQIVPGGGSPARERWSVVLSLELGDPGEAYRYRLLGGSVKLHLPDGTTFEQRLEQWEILLNTPRPYVPGVAWVGTDRPRVEEGRAGAWLWVPRPFAEALAAEGARLELDGHIEVQEPRALARIPIRAGAGMAHEGRRFRIAGLDGLGGHPVVNGVVESVGSRTESWGPSPWDVYEVAAVNPTRMEALALHPQSGGGGIGHELVLPGARAHVYRAGLAPIVPSRRDDPAVPASWWRGAELAITDWVSIGRYPVHVEVSDFRVER